jgi:hypothetical protein
MTNFVCQACGAPIRVERCISQWETCDVNPQTGNYIPVSKDAPMIVDVRYRCSQDTSHQPFPLDDADNFPRQTLWVAGEHAIKERE